MADRPRYKPGDTLPTTVTPGAVRVNVAAVRADYGDCILAEIDLHTKYAEHCSESYSEGAPPSVWLVAGDATLKTDEAQPRTSLTGITFDGLNDWRIFAASGPSRYTMTVVLTAPDWGSNG